MVSGLWPEADMTEVTDRWEHHHPCGLWLEDRNLTSPQPAILILCLDQSRPNRSLADIINFLLKAVVGSQDMIEELFLPDGATASEEQVNPPCRSTFDGMHDLRQTEAPSVRPS